MTDDDRRRTPALAEVEQDSSPAGLTNVDKPVLVVDGDDDTMLQQ